MLIWNLADPHPWVRCMPDRRRPIRVSAPRRLRTVLITVTRGTTLPLGPGPERVALGGGGPLTGEFLGSLPKRGMQGTRLAVRAATKDSGALVKR